MTAAVAEVMLRMPVLTELVVAPKPPIWLAARTVNVPFSPLRFTDFSVVRAKNLPSFATRYIWASPVHESLSLPNVAAVAVV